MKPLPLEIGSRVRLHSGDDVGTVDDDRAGMLGAEYVSVLWDSDKRFGVPCVEHVKDLVVLADEDHER